MSVAALALDPEGNGLAQLVNGADVVVSLLPQPLHPVVAAECIKQGVNMVTASYVSDAMQVLLLVVLVVITCGAYI